MKTNRVLKFLPLSSSTWSTLAATVLVWGGSLGFAQDPPPLPSDPNEPSPLLNPGRTTTLSFTESHFLREVAKEGDEDARISRLAAERASRSDVKEFAQRLAREQESINADVTRLASRKNLNLPSPTSSRLEKKWSEKKAGDFDADYIDKIVDDQTDTMKAVSKRTDATDPDVAAFARKILPAIRERQRAAVELKSVLKAKSPPISKS